MIKEKGTDKVFIIINYSLLVIVLLLVLYPLIFIVSASISDPVLINQGKMWLIPKGINFEGYSRVIANNRIWIGYRNTIFYTIAGTVINLIMTVLCAYPLSRKDFYGRNLLTGLFTFTMFFSGGLIPTYILIKQLGMLNNVWSMLIPGAVSMYNVIITRTYFINSIPGELYDSAMVDGCSNTRILLSIIIPLSQPILAVMALFYGVGHWNAFFNAMIYISDKELYPLQLVLREILIQQEMSEMLLSGSQMEVMSEQARISEMIKYSVIIVSVLPVLMIYPFLQRYFTHGIMVGSIKG